MLLILTPLGCTLYRAQPDRDVHEWPGYRAVDFHRCGFVGPSVYTVYPSDEQFNHHYAKFRPGAVRPVWWSDMTRMGEFPAFKTEAKR
jgi:hypothetical protein